MKKIVLTVSIFLFIFMAVGSAIAAESLEQSNGWSEYVDGGTVSITPSGEQLTFSAEDPTATTWGIMAWGRWAKDFPGAYGALATFKVDSYTGSEVHVGLRKFVGLTNTGNQIQARIFIQIFENQYRIRYQVREITEIPAWTVVQYFANGVLGDWDGMWKLGDQVTIGLALVGQDIYFYTPGVGAFTKVQLLDGMSPITSQYSSISFEMYAGKAGSKISGEVSNLTILK